ncbi:MAG: CBS domain-containing protein [bacterium]|nr:CBS domain-containing protein [bacterium]
MRNHCDNKRMRVSDVMQTDVITVPKGMVWRNVIQLLLRSNISGAPVVDADGHVIGVVSEKDLFRSLYPSYHDWYEGPDSFVSAEQMESEAQQVSKERPVEELMSKRLMTVSPDLPLVQVGAMMMSTGVHRIPVLKEGKLVGVVSRREVFRAILKEYMHINEQGEEI